MSDTAFDRGAEDSELNEVAGDFDCEHEHDFADGRKADG